MNITGYKLREAISRYKLRRETAASQFPDSLLVFQGEAKQSPGALVEVIEAAEHAIVRLQVMQMHYNGAVTVQSPRHGPVSLGFCIKEIGGLERVEKLWRSAAIKKKDRFRYSADSPELRDKDKMVANRAVALEQAAAQVERVQRELALLKQVVAVGNATEISFPDQAASLFE